MHSISDTIDASIGTTTRTRCLAAAIASILAHAAQAQDIQGASEVKQVEEIVVTGTNLRGIAVLDGPSPMVALTAEDLQVSGVATVYEALEKQPFFAGFADNNTRAGNSGRSSVNLRGLGAEFTLVLLNGRRIGVNDLNLLPFAAVERVEVLKDGASAVYGSDALAGVVNIILRKDFEGFETSVNYGNTTEYGDGGRLDVSVLMGASGERGRLTLTGQYEKQNSILSLEHPLGMTDDERVYGGIVDFRGPRRNPGLITLADGSQRMLGPGFDSGQTGSSAADYTTPYDLRIEKQRPNNLQNGKRVGTLFASGEYDLVDDRVVAFANFLYKDSKIDHVDHRGTFLNVTVPEENYWNPFGAPVRVSYLLDYGTVPGRIERAPETVQSNISTTLLTAGLKGVIGAFDYEIAYSNYDNENFQTHDGLSREGILRQLARTDAGALNLFGNAAVTEEQLSPARARFTRTLGDYVRSITGVVRFSPFDLPAGPLAMAVGAETRKQGFSITPDEALNIFGDSISLPFLNDSSEALGRSVDAYYAELNAPLFGGDNSMRGVHQLDLGLAVRHESFSDFGSATVPRYSLRWVPLADESLTLRASFSESFYAPDLVDLTPQGDININPYRDPLIVDAAGNPLVYNIETVRGGNPDLEPTTGEYINIGAIFQPQPLPGLSLSVDLWKLDQKDAFITPQEQAIINGVSPGTVTRASTPTPGDNYAGAPVARITRVIARVANAATREVSGVDFDLAYSFATDWGRWRAALYNSFTTTFDFDQADGNGTQEALGKFTAFGAVPKLRSSLALTHTFGSLTSNLAVSYFGAVDNTFVFEQQIDAYTRTDLAFSYAADAGLLAGVTLSLNIDNVFNEELPFVGIIHRTGIVADYSYGDPVGRFVSVGLRKQF